MPGRKPDPRSILDGLTDYLSYRRECGEVSLELDSEAAAVLTRITTAAARVAGGGVFEVTRRRTTTSAVHVGRHPPAATVRKVSPGGGKDAGKGEEVAAELARLAGDIASCRKCLLCRERTNTVPGQGNPSAPDVMFIGEAPGADEDRQGLAFVGRAGQLLTQMIGAMGYSRDEVFIANICKCRPPGNRAPTAEEMEACIPFLKDQIRVIRPKTIVAMGNTAILGLLGTTGISRLRGVWTTFEGIPLMPTFHPSYLLRFPTTKRDAWNDLKKVLKHLGRTVPRPAAKDSAEKVPPAKDAAE